MEKKPRPPLLTVQVRKELIRLIDAYEDRTGLADSGVSRAVFPTDKNFVKRLRAGDNFMIEKANRMERWLRRALRASAKLTPTRRAEAVG